MVKCLFIDDVFKVNRVHDAISRTSEYLISKDAKKDIEVSVKPILVL
jgi:hypothetical protein